MAGAWSDLSTPQPFQSLCEFDEHEILFQFSVLDQGSSLLLGRSNRVYVIGMPPALFFGFPGYAVEDRFSPFFTSLNNRHLSILRDPRGMRVPVRR